MTLRKMVVRSLVVLVLVLAGSGYYAFQRWTNPHAVRELVLRHFASRLLGADVRLAAAELRFLGGVNLHDLRVTAPGGDEPAAVLPEVVLNLDRERLTRGQVLLRKATVLRPHVNLVRRADGSWNVSGMSAVAQAGETAPVIDIQAGTFQFTDESIGAPPLRLADVCLALTPLTGTQMKVEGSAEVDLLGRAQVTGTLDTQTGGLVLALKLPRVDITPALLERLNVLLPRLKHEPIELSGRLAVEASLIFQPGAPQPLLLSAAAQLADGRLVHQALPLPAQKLAADLGWDGNRLTIRHCTGELQGGRLTASGSITLGGSAEASVQLVGGVVTPAIYTKLPPVLRNLCDEFRPTGRLDFTGQGKWERGQLTYSYRASPRDMQVLFDGFPYPVNNLSGELDYSEAGTDPQLKVNLSGQASGQPVKMTGRAFGIGLRPDNELKCGFHLFVEAERIPIDDVLLDALKPFPHTLRLARQFRASGRVTCHGQLERPEGTQPGLRPLVKQNLTLHLFEGAFTFEEFPCRLEEVTGTLEVGPKPDAWRFYNFRGKRQGAVVTGSGRFDPSPEGDRLRVDLEAHQLPLDEELKEALPPSAREAWDHFQPTGLVSGRLSYEQVVGKQPPTIELLILPQGGTIKPACFPYLLTEVRGQIHYKAPWVVVSRLSARHGPALLALRHGTVQVRPRGGFRVELQDLTASQLVVDKDLVAAVPNLLRSALQTLQPDQPLRLAANVVIDDPGAIGSTRCSWGGIVALDNTRLQCGIELSEVTGQITLSGLHDGQRLYAKGQLQLDQATFHGQPFKNLQAGVSLTSEEILLSQFQGTLHGGKIQGEIRVNFTSSMNFTVDMLGQQIDLAPLMQAALGRSTEVRGKLEARMLLSGSGGDLRSLRGQGRVRVEEGARIYDVPLILDLINHFSRHLPKNTSFQEAEAHFDVAGEQLKINRLLLSSAALTLRGQGEMKANGTDLNLEMYGVPYGRAVPLLPPLIDRIPPTISKQLMKIRLRGSMAKVQITTEPLPAVVEPIVDMFRTFSEPPGKP